MAVYFTASYSTKRFAATLGSVLLTFGLVVAVLTAIQPQDLRLFLGYFFALVFGAAGMWLSKVAVKEKSTIYWGVKRQRPS